MSSPMSGTLLKKYGPWAVVTGASDGIGRAMAEQLAAQGLNLVLVSRRQSHLDQLASDILAKYSVQIRTMAVDLSSSDGNQKLFAFTKDLEVGLLCAAAGFGARARMTMGQAANPNQVARATLAALGRQITVRPGFLAKLLGWSLLTLNRWGRIRVLKLIMQGMVSPSSSTLKS